MPKTKREVEELKGQITSLKIRLRRIEDFLLCIPNSEEWIHKEDNEEDLIEQAKDLVSKYDRVSASLLQRRLMIGYARAASLIDKLEDLGVISSSEGSKPRDVLIKKTNKKEK